jgi:hypothetical protein
MMMRSGFGCFWTLPVGLIVRRHKRDSLSMDYLFSFFFCKIKEVSALLTKSLLRESFALIGTCRNVLPKWRTIPAVISHRVLEGIEVHSAALHPNCLLFHGFIAFVFRPFYPGDISSYIWLVLGEPSLCTSRITSVRVPYLNINLLSDNVKCACG